MSFRAKLEIPVVSDVLRWLKNGLFPVSCVGCGAEGSVVCDPCLSSVPLLEQRHVNLDDNKTSDRMHFCRGLNQVLAIARYSHPVVKGIIRGLKFSFAEEFRPALEQLVRRGVVKYQAMLPSGSDVVIVSVPTTTERFRKRGFDHVRWIADIVAATTKHPIGCNLVLAKEHEPQSHMMDEAARKTNIAGAFKVLKPVILSEGEARVEGSRIILVDDVVTTGSTLSEAASALLSAGAKEVHAFTLARSK